MLSMLPARLSFLFARSPFTCIHPIRSPKLLSGSKKSSATNGIDEEHIRFWCSATTKSLFLSRKLVVSYVTSPERVTRQGKE